RHRLVDRDRRHLVRPPAHAAAPAANSVAGAGAAAMADRAIATQADRALAGAPAAGSAAAEADAERTRAVGFFAADAVQPARDVAGAGQRAERGAFPDDRGRCR